jgi:hypothetical protein
MAVGLSTITGNIPANASLSGAFNCTTGTVARIVMPNNWVNAPISFQVSLDNVTYYDLFDSAGREVLFQVQPGVAVTVLEERSISFAYVKIRSGSRDKPVVQPLLSTFNLVVSA